MQGGHVSASVSQLPGGCKGVRTAALQIQGHTLLHCPDCCHGYIYIVSSPIPACYFDIKQICTIGSLAVVIFLLFCVGLCLKKFFFPIFLCECNYAGIFIDLTSGDFVDLHETEHEVSQ